jgi:hypothetical protein
LKTARCDKPEALGPTHPQRGKKKKKKGKSDILEKEKVVWVCVFLGRT